MASKTENHIAVLDGLRGLMAFWVFYGHLKILCVQTTPRIGHPANAVDVFMFLSGFLMAFHWTAREKRFSSFKSQMSDFYIRRFFRIAPLYYLLLFIALVFQSSLGDAHAYIKSVLPAAQPLPSEVSTAAHYVDPTDRTVSWANVLSHITFLFGFFPQYVSSNFLPDWSIGLEMQFYLAFPFLLLALRRVGAIWFVVASVGVVWLTGRLFSLYDSPANILGNFPQPGFLAFKLHIFVGGIFIARFYELWKERKGIEWLIVGFACLSWRTSLILVGTVALLVYYLCVERQKTDLLQKLLAGRLGRFLGDTSYSVYLLHTLLLYPILAFLLTFGWFQSSSANLKLIVLFVLVAIPLYLLAFAAFHLVEVRGIALGRRIAQRVRASTEPEIAAQSTPAALP